MIIQVKLVPKRNFVGDISELLQQDGWIEKAECSCFITTSLDTISDFFYPPFSLHSKLKAQQFDQFTQLLLLLQKVWKVSCLMSMWHRLNNGGFLLKIHWLIVAPQKLYKTSSPEMETLSFFNFSPLNFLPKSDQYFEFVTQQYDLLGERLNLDE